MIAEHSHTHTRAMHHPSRAELNNSKPRAPTPTHPLGERNGKRDFTIEVDRREHPPNAFHSPRKMKIVNNTDLVACSISEAIQVIKLHFYRVARNSGILIVWPISLTYAWRLRSL